MAYTKIEIVVVGCGGTGSHYVKELGRLLYGHVEKPNVTLTLIDGDLVEERNLVRQAFLKQDIGRNKAEVMSEILAEAYQIPSAYYDRYIDNASDLAKLTDKNHLVLLVGCVDNHQCRQSMHAYYESLPNCIYMDSANEFSAGEVIVGSRIAGVEMYPDRCRFFPDVLENSGKKRSEESCEVLNAAQPQHMLTNQMAAWILLVNTCRVLDDAWTGGIYFFDAFKCYCMDRTNRKEPENEKTRDDAA